MIQHDSTTPRHKLHLLRKLCRAWDPENIRPFAGVAACISPDGWGNSSDLCAIHSLLATLLFYWC
jgi:hypothetical protein